MSGTTVLPLFGPPAPDKAELFSSFKPNQKRVLSFGMNDNNLKTHYCIRHLLYATTHHQHFPLSLQRFNSAQVVLPHFWGLLIRTILNIRKVAGHGCTHRIVAGRIVPWSELGTCSSQSTHCAQLLRTGVFAPTRA
jgi:hypothetical protein